MQTNQLQSRNWVPPEQESFVQSIAGSLHGLRESGIFQRLQDLLDMNGRIDNTCINLNPATNILNPRAAAMLASPMGMRPSLGYPGAKYEAGLEAIEQVEVIAAELAARVFGANFVEVRVPSGSIANLYGFMATCQPGDAIIVPPASIGGHVTHHADGAAGLYGLKIHSAAVDADRFSIDVSGLREQAHRLQPRLITIGGSLNLAAHPIREIRAIADEVGAKVMFDAAHLSGMIAGRAWQQPLMEGAHFMTMSTYKSLGGPPSGLVVTNDEAIAKRLDAIAYPGLTANFDASKTAALAVSLLDWLAYGSDYAAAMKLTARALAQALSDEGVPVHTTLHGFTESHQVAIQAARYGGGQAAARRLRKANLLASGIGLPIAEVPGDMNGLRLGTPEIVRLGMGPRHMPDLARLIARSLHSDEDAVNLSGQVREMRQAFAELHFMLP